MKLHWSPRSPFVRKVMVFAHEAGLVDRLTCVRTVVAMKTPNAALLPDNPLSEDSNPGVRRRFAALQLRGDMRVSGYAA